MSREADAFGRLSERHRQFKPEFPCGSVRSFLYKCLFVGLHVVYREYIITMWQYVAPGITELSRIDARLKARGAWFEAFLSTFGTLGRDLHQRCGGTNDSFVHCRLDRNPSDPSKCGGNCLHVQVFESVVLLGQRFDWYGFYGVR